MSQAWPTCAGVGIRVAGVTGFGLFPGDCASAAWLGSLPSNLIWGPNRAWAFWFPHGSHMGLGRIGKYSITQETTIKATGVLYSGFHAQQGLCGGNPNLPVLASWKAMGQVGCKSVQALEIPHTPDSSHEQVINLDAKTYESHQDSKQVLFWLDCHILPEVYEETKRHSLKPLYHSAHGNQGAPLARKARRVLLIVWTSLNWDCKS